MNPRINKLAREIDRTRARIADDQERLKAMEKQRFDMENWEVVKLFRHADIDPRLIAEFIRSCREDGNNAAHAPAPEAAAPVSRDESGRTEPEAVPQNVSLEFEPETDESEAEEDFDDDN